MELTRSFLDILVKQLKWYGHVQRMGEDGLLKQVITWYPVGRKKRKGLPKTTCMDEIIEYCEKCVYTEDYWRYRENWQQKATRQI